MSTVERGHRLGEAVAQRGFDFPAPVAGQPRRRSILTGLDGGCPLGLSSRRVAPGLGVFSPCSRRLADCRRDVLVPLVSPAPGQPCTLLQRCRDSSASRQTPPLRRHFLERPRRLPPRVAAASPPTPTRRRRQVEHLVERRQAVEQLAERQRPLTRERPLHGSSRHAQRSSSDVLPNTSVDHRLQLTHLPVAQRTRSPHISQRF